MTSEPAAAEKRMRLRYSGTCRLCTARISAGTEAIYERDTKTVRCVQCAQINEDSPDERRDSGTAGASARREFERRRDSRQRRIREAHPKLGGLMLALSDDPQSTQAWQRGAIGEELLAARLEDLPDSFQVLHDRRIPGTRANIDHIAIGPSGVWVIDAKRYKSKRPELHVDGGILRPRVETLRIGGRDGTKLVRGVHTQVEKVSEALQGAVPVTGVLCFLEADWPLFGGPFSVDGVQVTWPRALVRRMTSTSDGAAETDADAIHARLASMFPVA